MSSHTTTIFYTRYTASHLYTSFKMMLPVPALGAHIVKKCIDILLPSLTKLVNLSLRNGIFPNPFKQAIVTPLLKKSTLSKEDLKSYRPVSGLSFLSKLVEHIVAAQIRSHMDSHDLSNTFQSVYKVGHSTETALLCIKNEINLSLSKGMPTALVLLDLSAAFDTIDHDTLLSCLSARFSFAGIALKWFRSYLQDHFHSVKIGSTLSNLFKLSFRVHQGSVLGPRLCSLYTTPLGQVISKYTGVKHHFYADDTHLFIHLSPDDNLKSLDRLKSCLNDIQVWMSENKLKLNSDKTEFIVFGAKTDTNGSVTLFLSISWEIVSLPQMLLAIWVSCLMQSFVSPIT